MNMQDAELLWEYARNGSETAFAELVKRYVDLVVLQRPPTTR